MIGRTLRHLLLSLFTILLVFSQSVKVLGEDWLTIYGEKGFFLDYNENYQNTGTFDSQNGFNFSQSLTLNLEGEFGKGYAIKGLLADQPYAPGQLFLEITGEDAGLRFGDGKLDSFSTALTKWSGDINGLEAFYQNGGNRFKLAYANPTGIPTSEQVTLRAGRNYVYLNRLPIKEGSLKIRSQGVELIEGLEYAIDYYTGKLELLKFSGYDRVLQLDYLYYPSEVLGNNFMAFSEQSAWGNFRTGFNYFGSQSQRSSGPVLLGEEARPAAFDLGGVNFGYNSDKWRWDMEVLNSIDQHRTAWDYLDNMEGDETISEAFVGTNDPINWFVNQSGSGSLMLSRISPGEDVKHTRDGLSSLLLDYQLKRTGDSVDLYHDFGLNRDLSLFSKLAYWLFLDGKDLRLEVALVTNENSYFYYQLPLEGSGWHEVSIPLDVEKLDSFGFPDLKKVRYLRLTITSPGGNQCEGELYQSVIYLTAKSLAGQRWSETESSLGSIIQISTAQAMVPGTTAENEVLKISYTLAANGWAKVKYQPSLPVNLSQYRSLSLFLKPINQQPNPSPVRLTVLAGRQGAEYSLGELEVTPNLWQEYSLPLKGVPGWILEQLDEIILKLDNSIGSQELLVDEIRVTDRQAKDATAYKVRGDYTSGPWSNRLEFSQYQPGFHDLSRSYQYDSYNWRNHSQFMNEDWKVQAEIESYRNTASNGGFPTDAKRLLTNINYHQTTVTASRQTETAQSGIGTTGENVETRLGLNQQWSAWNLGLNSYWMDNSINERKLSFGDAVTLKFQQDYYWATVEYWQDQMELNSVPSTQSGKNWGLGIDPPGENRVQINGGIVNTKGDLVEKSSYFWQSDLTYRVTEWWTTRGNFKLQINPEADREDVTSDRFYNLNLTVTPLAQLQFETDQMLHNWRLEADGYSEQYSQQYQGVYHFNDQAKAGAVVRLEELATDSGSSIKGERYGVFSDLYLVNPWYTQAALEYNRNLNQLELLDTRQSSYKVNLQNTYQQSAWSCFWGGWAEGLDAATDLERRMAQFGWEQQLGLYWRYGTKTDLGYESVSRNQELIWGSGGFIKLAKLPNSLEINLRYQTYDEYRWRASLNYQFLQGDLMSLTFKGDYLQQPSRAHSFNLRLDLLFYLK